MNIIYVSKNPSPVPQTITIPKGKSLGNSGIVSREPITIQVPPRSIREIRYDEFGHPISEGCIQDLIIAETVLIRLVQKEVYEEDIALLKSGNNVKKNSAIFKLDPFLDSISVLRVC